MDNSSDYILNVYITKEEQQLSEYFMECYSPYKYQGTVEDNLRESKKSKRLINACRFCKKTRDETKFTQKTHLLSQLLGNRGYYSYDECDSCNQIFRVFESDLAAYLGTHRTLNPSFTNFKAPSFESGSGNIGIQKGRNGIIHLENKGVRNDDFKINLQQGTGYIKIETQQYKPINVYRSILKMALSVLPESDLEDYENAFRFLLNSQSMPYWKQAQFASIVVTNIYQSCPFALLFKRKTADNEFPEHMFCLYTQNLMFQIFMPCYKYFDEKQFNNVKFQLSPYVQIDSSIDNIILNRSMENFQTEDKRQQDHSINFDFKTDNIVGIKADHIIKTLKDSANQ